MALTIKNLAALPQIQSFPLNLKKDLLSLERGRKGPPKNNRGIIIPGSGVVDSGWSKLQMSITVPFSSFILFGMV